MFRELISGGRSVMGWTVNGLLSGNRNLVGATGFSRYRDRVSMDLDLYLKEMAIFFE